MAASAVASYADFTGQLQLQRTQTQEDRPVLNRIANVKPVPVPRTHGHTPHNAEQLLVLIGDGSDADDVLSFFREMWPEVEGADRGRHGLSAAND